MLRSVVSLAAMLALVASAAAQDVSRYDKAIGALSSPPTAEELTSLGTTNQNAYVYFLQEFLAGKGIYSGATDGQLNTRTIKAIVGYCREAGIADACVQGPLTPNAVTALATALSTDLAGVPPTPAVRPAVAAVESTETVAEPEAAVAESQPKIDAPAPLVPAVLPTGWKLNDNGGRGSLGLTAEIVSADTDMAVIHFSGTAAMDGYLNVDVGPAQPWAAGIWTASLSAARESAAGSRGEMWLRTAMTSETDYLGELFEGVPVAEAVVPTRLSGSGSPTAGTVRLMPYVQLWVKAGDKVDTVVRLAAPSLSVAP